MILTAPSCRHSSCYRVVVRLQVFAVEEQLVLQLRYHCLATAVFGCMTGIVVDSHSRKRHPSLLLVQLLLLQADVEWVVVEEVIALGKFVAQEARVKVVFLHSRQSLEQMGGLGMVVGRSPLVLRVGPEKVFCCSLQELRKDPVKDVCHSLALTDFCHNLLSPRCHSQVVALLAHDPFRQL